MATAPEASKRFEALPRHLLSAEDFIALAQGDGDEHTLERLLAVERSRRLLLLRGLDNLMSRHRQPPATSFDFPGLAPAWELLTRVQRDNPGVFEDVLMYPQTGMWLAYTLRRLGGAAQEETPLWVVLGHMAALAAAAGVRAGLDFDIAVPIRHGYVPLPTLGCAALPVVEAAPWAGARVRTAGGQVHVEAFGATVVLPPRTDEDGPGWCAIRRFHVGPTDGRLSVVLDDLDPYRTYPRPTEPLPLRRETATHWERLLERAWTMLLEDEPQTARAMRGGLRSLNPVPAGEQFRPRSVTTGDAFGGVVISEPDSAVQLAATLVHEFQHTKLGSLLHLAPLYVAEPGQDAELYYAPWRDDPRPLAGLLQGIYAFAGVTRFWRAHRHSADPVTAALAHFEFALWRAQVWSTLLTVHRNQRLTPLGVAFLHVLGRVCARWLDDLVPPEHQALAEVAAADHRARWRGHHLKPPAPAVDAAVRAWLRGDECPPAALAEDPALVPDPSAQWLDSMATLTRHQLGDPNGLRALLREESERTGAGGEGVLAGDILLAIGDSAAAARSYTELLLANQGHPGAWAGLGRALTADGAQPDAARLLLCHPERARTVHRALWEATGVAVEPVLLAAWLGAAR